MIRILFIVPYPEMQEKAAHVIATHPERNRLEVTVRVLTVDEAPVAASDNFDAVISRGYTARKMADSNPAIPVIPLTITGFDIVRAMRECCERFHPKKIAVIGFEQQLFEVRDLSQIFQTEVEIHSSYHYEMLPAIVRQAKENGCDALIGGYSACLNAEKEGLPFIVYRTGEAAIQQAIDEAVHTVKRIQMERMKSQLYKTLLYSLREGVLFVDSGGRICVRSYAAKKMHGDLHLLDQKLDTALPYLAGTFRSVLRSMREETLQVTPIPGTKIKASISCRPVIVDHEVKGVIFTFSDITEIQKLESQIRRKLSERGLNAKYDFTDIIHESMEMEETIETALHYAASDSNVIIVGETGTGKELFAQSIHRHSGRQNGPFVVINCAALTENLLESELFGYSEGAFTGASKGGKMGLFEQAHGGTLFLDELEEIPLPTQTKLLRVLQEKQIRRVGDNKVIDVDVRIISATNKSIRKLCEQGAFRQDLMYRLDVLRLFVPPLRRRGGDKEVIFLHLLSEQCKRHARPVPLVTAGARAVLSAHPFYGNVRELRNLVERISVLANGDHVDEEMMRRALYPEDLEAETARAPEKTPGERERILEALRQCGGRRKEASELLGMDRSTLYRKMKKYKL